MKNVALFNTIVAEALDELNGVWEREEREYEQYVEEYWADYEFRLMCELGDRSYDYDLEEEERKANADYVGTYAIYFHGEYVDAVTARSLEDAEYIAYERYGADAIGCTIVCDEHNSWSATACLDYWTYGDDTITVAEVLEYLKAVAYARANFHKTATYGYDEDYEPCVKIRLCEEGDAYIKEHGGRLVEVYKY